MCLLFVVSVTHAIEVFNEKMHWPQLPDLSPTGIDIDNTWFILADDFKCTESGPITDVRIWASFFDDILPEVGVDSLAFALAIHADIPDDPMNPDDWSKPAEGPPLWFQEFFPGQYTVTQVADNISEDWYDLETEIWSNDNHQQAYQYDFEVTENPFPQEEGEIYWLAVKVLDDVGFGWKTTTARDPDLRWNDDAVWDKPGPLTWLPLTYPSGHEYAGESLDLAFVITPEPTTICLLGLGGLALLRKKR